MVRITLDSLPQLVRCGYGIDSLLPLVTIGERNGVEEIGLHIIYNLYYWWYQALLVRPSQADVLLCSLHAVHL